MRRSSKVITTSILLVLCLQIFLLSAPVEAVKRHAVRRLKGNKKVKGGSRNSKSRSGGGGGKKMKLKGKYLKQGSRQSKSGGTKASRYDNSNFNGYDYSYSEDSMEGEDRAQSDKEEYYRNKYNKYTEDDRPRLRYGGLSKIMSQSEGDFLGGGRFNGVACLSYQSSCDIIDYRYRSDFLLESYNTEDESEEGFCLTNVPDVMGDDDGFGVASGFVMKACNPENPSQRWVFTRFARKNPGIFTDGSRLDGLYMIQNLASGQFLRALETPSLLDQFDDIFEDDKYKDKRTEDSQDDGGGTYIESASLFTADMQDEQNLWVVNEDRFFTFNSSFFGLEDDIFGFAGDLLDAVPIDSERRQKGGRDNR